MLVLNHNWGQQVFVLEFQIRHPSCIHLAYFLNHYIPFLYLQNSDLLLTLYSINLKNGRFPLASQSKSTGHFQNENSKCLKVPYPIVGAKKQETFSNLLLSKAAKI